MPLRVAAVTLVAFMASAVLHAAGQTVTFRGADGRVVQGTVFEASRRPAPAVVLVPMLGRARTDWERVGDALADAGLTALAIDLPATQAPHAQELEGWHTVVGAAVTYLSSRPDVRASAIGVAGASLGATLAAVAAASDGRIRALALVSPSLEYRGVRMEGPMREFGSRPALLIASLHDPYAARSARTLAADAPGPREIRWAETAAHGSVLLARDPDSSAALVAWFRQLLD